MRILKFLLILAVVVLVTGYGMLFSMENTAQVPLSLVVLELPAQRLSVWLLLAFAAGGICGLLVASVSLLKHRAREHLLQRKLSRTERRLETALPPAVNN